MAEYTEADVASVNSKLQEFAKTLSPAEHAALSAVFQQAVGGSNEVEGYNYHQPFNVNGIVWYIDSAPPHTYTVPNEQQHPYSNVYTNTPSFTNEPHH